MDATGTPRKKSCIYRGRVEEIVVRKIFPDLIGVIEGNDIKGGGIKRGFLSAITCQDPL